MPVIKVASNSRIYEAMKDDMDVNAGTLVEGKSREEIREEMIDLLTRVVNGEKTKAEAERDGCFHLHDCPSAFLNDFHHRAHGEHRELFSKSKDKHIFTAERAETTEKHISWVEN